MLTTAYDCFAPFVTQKTRSRAHQGVVEKIFCSLQRLRAWRKETTWPIGFRWKSCLQVDARLIGQRENEDANREFCGVECESRFSTLDPKALQIVVARDGIEPPTPAFSGPRSTTELPGLRTDNLPEAAEMPRALSF